jgi:hypothetical protein
MARGDGCLTPNGWRHGANSSTPDAGALRPRHTFVRVRGDCSAVVEEALQPSSATHAQHDRAHGRMRADRSNAAPSRPTRSPAPEQRRRDSDKSERRISIATRQSSAAVKRDPTWVANADHSAHCAWRATRTMASDLPHMQAPINEPPAPGEPRRRARLQMPLRSMLPPSTLPPVRARPNVGRHQRSFRSLRPSGRRAPWPVTCLTCRLQSTNHPPQASPVGGPDCRCPRT